jgi:hypothetical protein
LHHSEGSSLQRNFFAIAIDVLGERCPDRYLFYPFQLLNCSLQRLGLFSEQHTTSCSVMTVLFCQRFCLVAPATALYHPAHRCLRASFESVLSVVVAHLPRKGCHEIATN